MPSYLGSHVIYFRGYTYTGRKGLSAVANSGHYSDLIGKPSLNAIDLVFPTNVSTEFILYSYINWILPSIAMTQSDWDTTDVTAASYIKHKPSITFDSENNMLFLGQINCANNVTAAAFYGSGAGLTNLPVVSSQWTTNGTNVYMASGHNVGIGKTNPACALDVVGGAKVSGSLDVSGGVNATSIVVGGSTAKQIDCGSNTTNGAMNFAVSFNFTFNNIPKVVCSINYDWGNSIVTSYTLHNISTTGFLVNAVWIGAGASMGNVSGATLTWIAIG